MNLPKHRPKRFRLSTHAVVLVALALTALLLLLVALPARGEGAGTVNAVVALGPALRACEGQRARRVQGSRLFRRSSGAEQPTRCG